MSDWYLSRFIACGLCGKKAEYTLRDEDYNQVRYLCKECAKQLIEQVPELRSGHVILD